MKKHTRLLSIVLMLTLVLGSVVGSAVAAPYIGNASYSAYIGENDYLYIINQLTGQVRFLPTAIEEILSIDTTALYCIANGGSLYSVTLDGSGSGLISSAPTQEDIDKYTQVLPYTLSEGALTVTVDGAAHPLAQSGVLAATVFDDTLYYIEQTVSGAVLKSFPLTFDAAAVPPSTTITTLQSVPTQLAVSDDYFAILDTTGYVTTINREDPVNKTVASPAPGVTDIALVGDEVIHYQRNLQTNKLHYLSRAPMPDTVVMPTAAVLTASPSPTDKPTATKTTGVDYDYDDGSLRLGARGNSVRKMQKRLDALGYPVGKIDGAFGSDTLRGVKLFQEQSGYSESTRITARQLNLLHSKKASEFDLYKSRQKGNAGERVRMLQSRLWDLGYKEVGTVDGVYGKRTYDAVYAFQDTANLTANGVANRDTMVILYSEDAPKKNGPTPTQKPDPSAKPTKKPTKSPSPTVFELKLGDNNDDVYEMKKALVEMKYLKQDPLTKKFDKETETIIKSIQKELKLKETGKVGEELYEMIINKTIPKPPEASVTPKVT